MCLSTCREKGFHYTGLQWQIECYCGNEPVNGFKWAWLDKCDASCAGNSDQICGGSNAMSLYTTPEIGLDTLCIYDNPSPRRVLNGLSIVGHTNMTIQNCQNVCEGSSLSRKTDNRIYRWYACLYFRFRLFWSTKWR